MKQYFKNFRLLTILVIFSCVTLCAFATNKIIKTADSEVEILSIGEEDGPYVLILNRLNCSGCGVCVSLAPDHFEMREDQKAGVREDAPSISESLAEEVNDSCPSDCFTIDYE
jgi:ferredoxin